MTDNSQTPDDNGGDENKLIAERRGKLAQLRAHSGNRSREAPTAHSPMIPPRLAGGQLHDAFGDRTAEWLEANRRACRSAAACCSSGHGARRALRRSPTGPARFSCFCSGCLGRCVTMPSGLGCRRYRRRRRRVVRTGPTSCPCAWIVCGCSSSHCALARQMARPG